MSSTSPLTRHRSYAYVAIDRPHPLCLPPILADRRAQTAAGFLARFLDRFPLSVHTILTDNGSRSPIASPSTRKASRTTNRPSDHAFDRICTRGIRSRTASSAPFARDRRHGERFNRRLGDHLGRRPQTAPPTTAASRPCAPNAMRILDAFVADYNRTRLRCLDYESAAELLCADVVGYSRLMGADEEGTSVAQPDTREIWWMSGSTNTAAALYARWVTGFSSSSVA